MGTASSSDRRVLEKTNNASLSGEQLSITFEQLVVREIEQSTVSVYVFMHDLV